MPEREQPLDLGQPPAPDGLRLPTPVHQRLEVAFQVRVAQRPPLGREPVIGRPAVRPDHPRKVGPQQRVHDRPTPAAVNPKHGQLGGHHRPQPGPLLLLPPAGLVHVDDRRLLDRGPGFLDDGRQGGTLRLLLAHHRAQRHPHRPQVLQQLPHFPPAQPIPATQERDHGGQPRPERPPRHAQQAGPLGCASHRPGSARTPSGTRSPAPPAAAAPPPDAARPGPATGCGLGKRLPTVPAALRDHRHDLVHLLDRQQRAVGPAVSRLAAALPAGGRRFRARGCLGRIRRRGTRGIGGVSGPGGLPARGCALAGPRSAPGRLTGSRPRSPVAGASRSVP